MKNRYCILFTILQLLVVTFPSGAKAEVRSNYSGTVSIGEDVKNDAFISRFIPFADRFKFDRSQSLVFTLWLAIIYCILTMLVIMPFILFNRNKMERKTVINQFLKEKYQELLIEFLYSEEDKKATIKNKLQGVAKTAYSQQFLINEIIDLSINLKGETTNELRKLYLELELDKLTYKKVKSKKWHVKIKAFRELAFMNLKNANEEIIKSLDSKNDILRMEAQIALVRLNEKDPFQFLNFLEKPFTLWEQMNIHELIMLHNINVPNFVQWVKSPNKSVSIFAINMIRVFKEEAAVHEVIGLLDHDDTELREASIATLGALKSKDGLKPLKDHFKRETYENKINILRSLQKNTDSSNIPFLKEVLETEDDVNIQVEAAKGIRDIGKTGEDELEKLITSDEYRNYLIVLRHVLDKRI